MWVPLSSIEKTFCCSASVASGTSRPSPRRNIYGRYRTRSGHRAHHIRQIRTPRRALVARIECTQGNDEHQRNADCFSNVLHCPHGASAMLGKLGGYRTALWFAIAVALTNLVGWSAIAFHNPHLTNRAVGICAASLAILFGLWTQYSFI